MRSGIPRSATDTDPPTNGRPADPATCNRRRSRTYAAATAKHQDACLLFSNTTSSDHNHHINPLKPIPGISVLPMLVESGNRLENRKSPHNDPRCDDVNLSVATFDTLCGQLRPQLLLIFVMTYTKLFFSMMTLFFCLFFVVFVFVDGTTIGL